MILLNVNIVRDGLDDIEIDAMVRDLKRELEDLPVAFPERPSPRSERGAKGSAMEIGDLIVTLAGTGGVLAGVVSSIQAWASRNERRRVKIEVGDDSIELVGVPEEERRAVIAAWLARHAPDE